MTSKNGFSLDYFPSSETLFKLVNVSWSSLPTPKGFPGRAGTAL